MLDQETLKKLPKPLLIVGPAHSGKSQLATQCLTGGKPTTVIGTTILKESILPPRIEFLQKSRPQHWRLVEEAKDISSVISEVTQDSDQLIIDSVNQWVARVLLDYTEGTPEGLVDNKVQPVLNEMLRIVSENKSKCDIVIVTSEMGATPPPERLVERIFRRQMGLFNQELARHCASVVSVQLGIPTLLKGTIT